MLAVTPDINIVTHTLKKQSRNAIHIIVNSLLREKVTSLRG